MHAAAAAGSGLREDVLSEAKQRLPRREGERQGEPTAWRARQLRTGRREELSQELPRAADAQQAAQGEVGQAQDARSH